MTYPVPAQQSTILYEVKKSQFYAYADKAENREQAMALLSTLKEKYPDARHHCWAYLLGNPHSPRSAAMSDDGEPSGTAGKPILNVLQHKGVGDLMLVVVRYFGGIKLGAGGLVRAYSAAAQQVMEQLPTQQQIAMKQVCIEVEFSQEQFLRHMIDQHHANIEACTYSNSVTLRVLWPEEKYALLKELAASHQFSLNTH